VMDNAKDEIQFIFQPLKDIHLYSDLRDETEPTGNGRMVNFLACMGILILAIAYANYINLSTGRALDRAKEVGVRKVAGASQGKLIRQFLIEALLLNSIAIILAITLNQLFVNTFNALTGKSTGFMPEQPYQFFAVVIACFILGSILSGAYPAFILSSYQPIAVLKGKLTQQSTNNYLRKGLVVFQFATAVVLIAATLAVHLQVAYMRSQDLNLNIDQILVFKAPIVTDSMYHHKIKVLKDNLSTSASIKRITTSSEVPGRQIYFSFDAIHPKNIRPEQVTSNFILSVDDDFVKTYGLQLIAGRDFNKQLATDKKGLLVNEAAAKLMGFESPQAAIDQPMVWEYNPDGEGYKIIGVVKNFHQQSLQYAYDPIILINDDSRNRFFSCKVQSSNIGQTIRTVEQAYQQLFPGNPFTYFFLDEFFEQQYQTDRQFGKIFGLFSSLAIFVACLGLVGLVSLVTRQRTKEIGVRKVLGASVHNILLLLSKDFIKLILTACFIAWPLAYLGIYQWLSNYAFRIPITPWLFLLPTLIVCVVALLAISMYTIKAARANPVKSLRYE
jgi:putative ABC transport system permease protein